MAIPVQFFCFLQREEGREGGREGGREDSNSKFSLFTNYTNILFPLLPPSNNFVYYFAADPVRLISQRGHTNNITVGRLEIFINNQWGTICDYIDGANIACRQLGLSSFSNAQAVSGRIG